MLRRSLSSGRALRAPGASRRAGTRRNRPMAAVAWPI